MRSKREQTIELQIEFVEWLKERGMYNQWASASVMQAMYEVWDHFQIENEEIK